MVARPQGARDLRRYEQISCQADLNSAISRASLSLQRKVLVALTQTVSTQSDPIQPFTSISTNSPKRREAIGQIVFGQENVIDLTLATLIAGGHGSWWAPGPCENASCDVDRRSVGAVLKTRQFTPDLMPGDILGSEVLEETTDGRREFSVHSGTNFCQL